jgi:ABC-2 type transport system permease protein
VTLTLIVSSCHMLRLPLERTLFFSVAITVMTFTLTAMAVGLGVLYPNFKEENPSKIVSGFGGTFCLVMSFLYIVASVALLAIGSPWRITGGGVPLSNIVIGAGSFLLISCLLGAVPLWLGLRRLRTVEL